MYLHVHKAPLGPEPFFRHPMGMDERPTSDFVTALLVNLTLNRSNGVRLRDPILGYGYRHLSFVDNGHAAATRSFGSSPHSKCRQIRILTAFVYFSIAGKRRSAVMRVGATGNVPNATPAQTGSRMEVAIA